MRHNPAFDIVVAMPNANNNHDLGQCRSTSKLANDIAGYRSFVRHTLNDEM